MLIKLAYPRDEPELKMTSSYICKHNQRHHAVISSESLLSTLQMAVPSSASLLMLLGRRSGSDLINSMKRSTDAAVLIVAVQVHLTSIPRALFTRQYTSVRAIIPPRSYRDSNNKDHEV